MRDLLSDLDRWLQDDEQIALATLVDAQGSAPRPTGARLFTSASGRVAGSISGGCVDSDVIERARGVLADGSPDLVRYDSAEESSFEVGLSCGGSMDVLIEPFVSDAPWQALRDELDREQPVALCVGITPEPIRGRRFVVPGHGAVTGSLDPALDDAVADAARRNLEQGIDANLSLPWRDGEARIFVEAFPAPQRLYIVGATHTAIHLCRLAKAVGFRVIIIDPRSTLATEERFAEADQVLASWPDQALADVTLDEDAHLVTLAHDGKLDIPALGQAVRSEARYVGALGSRKTHAMRREELAGQGYSASELDRIHSPVGLDLGGRSPEEVALAILAEIVAARHDRDGGRLRDRSGPIRARG